MERECFLKRKGGMKLLKRRGVTYEGGDLLKRERGFLRDFLREREEREGLLRRERGL
jgi:hypothetical protein